MYYNVPLQGTIHPSFLCQFSIFRSKCIKLPLRLIMFFMFITFIQYQSIKLATWRILFLPQIHHFVCLPGSLTRLATWWSYKIVDFGLGQIPFPFKIFKGLKFFACHTCCLQVLLMHWRSHIPCWTICLGAISNLCICTFLFHVVARFLQHFSIFWFLCRDRNQSEGGSATYGCTSKPGTYLCKFFRTKDPNSFRDRFTGGGKRMVSVESFIVE